MIDNLCFVLCREAEEGANNEVKTLTPEKQHDQEVVPTSEEKDTKEGATNENEEKEPEDKVTSETAKAAVY